MPKVKPNETKDQFVARCIPMVLDEDGMDGSDKKDRDKAVAKCYGIYRQSQKNESVSFEYFLKRIK